MMAFNVVQSITFCVLCLFASTSVEVMSTLLPAETPRIRAVLSQLQGGSSFATTIEVTSLLTQPAVQAAVHIISKYYVRERTEPKG